MAGAYILGRRIGLISLDLDDTLVDTDGIAPQRVDDAIARAKELLGETLDPAVAASAREEALAIDPQWGRLAPLLRSFGVRGKRALIEEIRAAYNERLVDLLEMFEGVPQALSALRERCRLVIVTNGPVELQEAKLAKFGLREMVDRVVISEAIGMRKPEPAIFHHACSLVNVTPDEAIHVGDSPELDVKGASEAGLTAVWRRPEYPRHWPDGSPRPDAEISHVRELLEM